MTPVEQRKPIQRDRVLAWALLGRGVRQADWVAVAPDGGAPILRIASVIEVLERRYGYHFDRVPLHGGSCEYRLQHALDPAPTLAPAAHDQTTLPLAAEGAMPTDAIYR